MMTSLASLLEPPLDTYLPLTEDDPEELNEKYDI